MEHPKIERWTTHMRWREYIGNLSVLCVVEGIRNQKKQEQVLKLGDGTVT